MIDRKYLLVLVILLALALRADFFAIAVIAVAILLPAWLCLAIFEAGASALAPQLQRDLINFRHKPKRVAPRLVRHLGLDLPHPDAVLVDKAKALAKAASAVTLRHPNPITGPVRLDRLMQNLLTLLPKENKSFVLHLERTWTGPVPGVATLGGLWLHLRRTLGAVLFPGVTRKVDGNVGLRELRARLAILAGFSPLTVKTNLLPLRAQRLLTAGAAILDGTPAKARIARLLNPSHTGLFKILAENRGKRQQASSQQSAATKEAAPNWRAKDSLTEAEISTLIAERAQDSILLNRIWPPGSPAPGNSWLGGLPCLPVDMDWPRNPQTGLPLHFLAQVDCADLPTLQGTSPLPRHGLLLFFSDLDEERLAESDAVVHVPKARQTVPPRALPDDLPEIDHRAGEPTSFSDNPGMRHYPKWPVVPVAVKVWAGEEDAHPKTRNYDYLDRARAAQDSSLAAVMPPPVASRRLGDIFPYRQRKDAEGKTILTADGKAIPYAVFDPEALPQGFPFCGAGIDAFVNRLQAQATKAVRRAESDRSFIDAKWNDTEEKRARKRAEADQAEAHARACDALARDARAALGALPPLTPVAQDTVTRLHRWLSGMTDQSRNLHAGIQRGLSDCLLDLARAAVTDPTLLARLPDSVFAAHATSLLPSPRHAQHLMLGPAQTKTNSTAGKGIRLLCLDSDYGPGMMYCDCGVLEYWIDPGDLAAQRFDRVRAETAGG